MLRDSRLFCFFYVHARVESAQEEEEESCTASQRCNFGKMDIQTTALGKRAAAVSPGVSNCGSLNTCRRAVIGNGNRQDVSSDLCVCLVNLPSLAVKRNPVHVPFILMPSDYYYTTGNHVSHTCRDATDRSRPAPAIFFCFFSFFPILPFFGQFYIYVD